MSTTKLLEKRLKRKWISYDSPGQTSRPSVTLLSNEGDSLRSAAVTISLREVTLKTTMFLILAFFATVITQNALAGSPLVQTSELNGVEIFYTYSGGDLITSSIPPKESNTDS